MALSYSESTKDSPELLKNLADIISENNKDVAIKIYELMRSCLLDRNINLSSKPVSQNPFERNLYDPNELDKFLFDQRVVKQYLETVNTKSSQQFIEFSNSLLNEKNMQNLKCLLPLKFLMAMGKKKNSEEAIIEKKIKISIPRLKTLKGRAPKPPESFSDCADRPSTSSNSVDVNINSKLRSSTSSMQVNGSHRLADMKNQDSVLKCSRITTSNINHDVGGDLLEWDVIEGLIFVWQGIESKIFRRCKKTLNYFLHDKWSVYPWIREQADNLASLGYLHDTVLPYGDTPLDGGLLRKCLAGFVRDELSDYYSLVAAVRTEFQKQATAETNVSRGLTLERLRLQSAGIARKFMDLISILESTKGDKGGILASGVFCFMRHGDPDLQNLVKAILAEICQPLYGMLMKWLLEGTLCDQSKEFFIAADGIVCGDRLWQEKYSIRMSMLPEFIPVQLAEKALSVGRSINFLRERCNNEEPYAEKEKIKNLFESRSAEVMYLSEQSSELEHLVDEVYAETNKRVLDVLLQKYALFDHFQAHKKFLLLGQGEFVYYLMDLLMQVLEKPASQLHPHYLNSILDSAVRATTAQYAPEDIINRLDAATLIHADGDNGWEVFYLRYHVDGPIGTVFSPSCRNEYQKLFCALWKAKRMEMILSKSWKHQIISSKTLRKIPDLGPILRKCFELTSEMLHFVRQTQYYFLFEVLECEWNKLLEDINLATNLDSVIESHTEFLMKVTAGVFMDDKHKKLALQLRIVYDLVLSLVNHVDELVLTSENEAQQRKTARGPASGLISAGEGSKIEYLQRRRDFVNRFLPETNSRLRSLGETYRRAIQKFLLTLNSEEDLNLQLLSVRLDFNSYYKELDSAVEKPLTFEHRRMSSLTVELSPILTRKLSSVKRTGK